MNLTCCSNIFDHDPCWTPAVLFFSLEQEPAGWAIISPRLIHHDPSFVLISPGLHFTLARRSLKTDRTCCRASYEVSACTTAWGMITGVWPVPTSLAGSNHLSRRHEIK